MRDYLKETFELYYYHPGHALWRALESRLLNQIPNWQRPPILDIGCGDGTFATLVFRQKIHTGLDLDSKNVEKAKKIALYQNVILADAQNLPFKDESFRTVFSNCTFEHIPNLQGLLKESARVLKKGGNLVITVPSHLHKTEKELNRKLSMLHFLSPREWSQKLKKNGLKVFFQKYYFSKDDLDFYKRYYKLLNSGLGPFNLFNLFYLLSFLKLLSFRYFYPQLKEVYEKDIKDDNPPMGYAQLIMAQKL